MRNLLKGKICSGRKIKVWGHSLFGKLIGSSINLVSISTQVMEFRLNSKRIHWKKVAYKILKSKSSWNWIVSLFLYFDRFLVVWFCLQRYNAKNFVYLRWHLSRIFILKTKEVSLSTSLQWTKCIICTKHYNYKIFWCNNLKMLKKVKAGC